MLFAVTADGLAAPQRRVREAQAQTETFGAGPEQLLHGCAMPRLPCNVSACSCLFRAHLVRLRVSRDYFSLNFIMFMLLWFVGTMIAFFSLSVTVLVCRFDTSLGFAVVFCNCALPCLALAMLVFVSAFRYVCSFFSLRSLMHTVALLLHVKLCACQCLVFMFAFAVRLCSATHKLWLCAQTAPHNCASQLAAWRA